ncbi:hypothetical protein GWI33_013018 [Rhynchophorus ferrugineus]|uniref:Uncharacterized protein n=1 Tax=Rhynchophorus ferrugineus TaxID=354439 RepID=A0A834I815_RHYFE|nr:hypothetical protein GWI33_013018 [Rhynchophorus ferrugineus]
MRPSRLRTGPEHLRRPYPPSAPPLPAARRQLLNVIFGITFVESVSRFGSLSTGSLRSVLVATLFLERDPSSRKR